MNLKDVLVRSTANPAKEIGRYPELGTLGVGRVADIAVLDEQTGVFAFKDSWPAKKLGTNRLECVLTVRSGQVVYQRASSGTGGQDTTLYDLLVKHARLGNQDVDVAVIGNKVVRVERGLKAAHAHVVVEAEGYSLRSLNQDRVADITLLDGSRPIFIVQAGKIIRDDEALSIPDASRAGVYSNFK
jgi:predicted amidohydrolase